MSVLTEIYEVLEKLTVPIQVADYNNIFIMSYQAIETALAPQNQALGFTYINIFRITRAERLKITSRPTNNKYPMRMEMYFVSKDDLINQPEYISYLDSLDLNPEHQCHIRIRVDINIPSQNYSNLITTRYKTFERSDLREAIFAHQAQYQNLINAGGFK